MAVALTKSEDEIRHLPLVELAWEILKVKKEPFYFRDLMKEIQELRGMSEDEIMHIIARLYTELNIDGRFVCIGQNVWGLKRWYPADKAEKAMSGKRFIRKSGDAFSDDDEDEDDYDGPVDDEEDAFVEEDDSVDDHEDGDLGVSDDMDDEEDAEEYDGLTETDDDSDEDEDELIEEDSDAEEENV